MIKCIIKFIQLLAIYGTNRGLKKKAIYDIQDKQKI